MEDIIETQKELLEHSVIIDIKTYEHLESCRKQLEIIIRNSQDSEDESITQFIGQCYKEYNRLHGLLWK